MNYARDDERYYRDDEHHYAFHFGEVYGLGSADLGVGATMTDAGVDSSDDPTVPGIERMLAAGHDFVRHSAPIRRALGQRDVAEVDVSLGGSSATPERSSRSETDRELPVLVSDPTPPGYRDGDHDKVWEWLYG